MNAISTLHRVIQSINIKRMADDTKPTACAMHQFVTIYMQLKINPLADAETSIVFSSLAGNLHAFYTL